MTMLRQAMLSDLGSGRGSFFSRPLSLEGRIQYGLSAKLGVSAAQWYARAQNAVAQFDALVVRTAKIANQTYRNEVVAWVGDPSSSDTPRERYNTVVWDMNRAKSYTPLNTTEYDRSQLQNRVTKLEDYNQDFAAKVIAGENLYGILPEPVVIERFTNVSVPSEPPSWEMPLLVGAGILLATGIAFMIFRKK